MVCPANPLAVDTGRPPKSSAVPRRDYAEQTTTPEPHFLPGYTGHTPGYDEHKLGKTYAHCNSEALRTHPVAGNRLSRIPGDCKLQVTRSPPERRRGNPHETLEPHFVPGYTGYTPASGIKRAEFVGQTYGKATHVFLGRHDVAGGRLRPVFRHPPEYVAEEEDVKFYCYEHELTRDDLRRRKDQVPGYTGHVPRAAFRHGRTKTKITGQAIAEFQRLMR